MDASRPPEAHAVRRLGRDDLAALERHLLALDEQDRRLRFGVVLGDAAIAAYVEEIDLGGDVAFGIDDAELELLGAVHVALQRDHAELGLSVRAGARGRGIGSALLRRAHTHARNAGLRRLYMHCLLENAAMVRMARREGMRIVSSHGESDALLDLPPPDMASHVDEVLADGVALFDHALKTQVEGARRNAAAWLAALRVPRAGD